MLGSPPNFSSISVHSRDLSTGSTPTAKCKTLMPLHGSILLISTGVSCRNRSTELKIDRYTFYKSLQESTSQSPVVQAARFQMQF